MKKLTFLACVALTLASHAAYEKFGVLRLADTTSLTNAAAQLGGHIGMPDLDKGIFAGCEEAIPTQVLGSKRAGAPLGNVMYIPSDDATLSTANFSQKMQMVVVYPTLTRKDFVKEYELSASETNGVIRLVSVEPESDFVVTNYIAYAKDNRWAAFATTAELALAALAETNNIENAALDGNFCDITIEGKHLPKILKEMDDTQKQELKDIQSIKVGLRVNEKGLDLRGEIKLAKEASLLRKYNKPLAGAALSFANKDALFAAETVAVTEDIPLATLLTDLKKLLTKYGYKADSIVCEATNDVSLITFDLKRFLKENKNATNSFNLAQAPQALLADIAALTNSTAAKVTNAAPRRIAFSIKDAKGACSPAERFASVLPEVKAKPVSVAFAGTFYGLLKIFIGHSITANDKIDDETTKMVAFMLAALPSAEQGGTAGAYWCEGESLCFQYRLSTGELNGLSKLIQLSASLFMCVDDEEEAEEEAEGANANED